MPLDDGKYVLFKAEVLRGGIAGVSDEVLRAMIEENEVPGETYLVLRASDMFGSAGLFAYAHTIQTGLEMDRTLGPERLTGEERERLQSLADDVVQRALAWQRTASKVPD